jgi:hypothetical protein
LLCGRHWATPIFRAVSPINHIWRGFASRLAVIRSPAARWIVIVDALAPGWSIEGSDGAQDHAAGCAAHVRVSCTPLTTLATCGHGPPFAPTRSCSAHSWWATGPHPRPSILSVGLGDGADTRVALVEKQERRNGLALRLVNRPPIRDVRRTELSRQV